MSFEGETFDDVYEVNDTFYVSCSATDEYAAKKLMYRRLSDKGYKLFCKTLKSEDGLIHGVISEQELYRRPAQTTVSMLCEEVKEGLYRITLFVQKDRFI